MKKLLLMVMMLALTAMCGWSQQVYSVAADGFVNIRKSASPKAAVVGVLATNGCGAQLLNGNGRWWKVKVDGVSGFVNSRYVKLSEQPVRLSSVPTVYYQVVCRAKTMDEVKAFFFNCPDTFDGSPVYRTDADGETVYKVCISCHKTLADCQSAVKMTNELMGRDGYAEVWESVGLADCVYLPITPRGDPAIPLTPQ